MIHNCILGTPMWILICPIRVNFIYSSHSFFFFFFYREKRRDREKHRHERREIPIGCIPQISQPGTEPHNLGLYPDRESNWRPFVAQDDDEPIESHQPGHVVAIPCPKIYYLNFNKSVFKFHFSFCQNFFLNSYEIK